MIHGTSCSAAAARKLNRGSKSRNVYLPKVITAGRLARIDPEALSQRVGHSSVSFTMETYMHGDLEADREVAHALESVILAGRPEIGAGEDRGDGRRHYQVRYLCA